MKKIISWVVLCSLLLGLFPRYSWALSRQQIIDTLAKWDKGSPEFEKAMKELGKLSKDEQKGIAKKVAEKIVDDHRKLIGLIMDLGTIAGIVTITDIADVFLLVLGGIIGDALGIQLDKLMNILKKPCDEYGTPLSGASWLMNLLVTKLGFSAGEAFDFILALCGHRDFVPPTPPAPPLPPGPEEIKIIKEEERKQKEEEEKKKKEEEAQKKYQGLQGRLQELQEELRKKKEDNARKQKEMEDAIKEAENKLQEIGKQLAQNDKDQKNAEQEIKNLEAELEKLFDKSTVYIYQTASGKIIYGADQFKPAPGSGLTYHGWIIPPEKLKEIKNKEKEVAQAKQKLEDLKAEKESLEQKKKDLQNMINDLKTSLANLIEQCNQLQQAILDEKERVINQKHYLTSYLPSYIKDSFIKEYKYVMEEIGRSTTSYYSAVISFAYQGETREKFKIPDFNARIKELELALNERNISKIEQMVSSSYKDNQGKDKYSLLTSLRDDFRSLADLRIKFLTIDTLDVSTEHCLVNVKWLREASIGKSGQVWSSEGTTELYISWSGEEFGPVEFGPVVTMSRDRTCTGEFCTLTSQKGDLLFGLSDFTGALNITNGRIDGQEVITPLPIDDGGISVMGPIQLSLGQGVDLKTGKVVCAETCKYDFCYFDDGMGNYQLKAGPGGGIQKLPGVSSLSQVREVPTSGYVPGINCGPGEADGVYAVCTENFECGTAIVLVASPTSGYVFVIWAYNPYGNNF